MGRAGPPEGSVHLFRQQHPLSGSWWHVPILAASVGLCSLCQHLGTLISGVTVCASVW